MVPAPSDGVISAFYIWVNGVKVGYSENSMSPAEFNISPYIKPGRNLVAVQVYKFSDGSYLEDGYWIAVSYRADTTPVGVHIDC